MHVRSLVKSLLRFLFEGSLIITISLYCAWLFYLPLFWELAEQDVTYQVAFDQIFFNTGERTLTLGGGLDHIGTVWIFGTVNQMISGEMETVLPHIYYPVGFDLGKHTGFAWADAAMSRPLIQWLGVPGFYNLHVLLTLTLTQAAATILLRACKVPLPIAIGLGAFAIMHPFAIEEMGQGRPTQMHWFFHAFFLYTRNAGTASSLGSPGPLDPLLLYESFRGKPHLF